MNQIILQSEQSPESFIPVTVNDAGEPQVSGRALHQWLDVQTPYDKWFSRMCEYGFDQGIDFSTILSESTGGQPATEHLMNLDMAEELCMLSRSDRGKLARRYFLELEISWERGISHLQQRWYMSRTVSGGTAYRSWR